MILFDILRIFIFLSWSFCSVSEFPKHVTNRAVTFTSFEELQRFKRLSASINSHIFYLATDEGILSHYRQLEIVWASVQQFNRTVVALVSESEHYPELSYISLCNIFSLPPNIICLAHVTPKELSRKVDCTYTALMHPERCYRYFGVRFKNNRKFSYIDTPCIAGFIDTDIGHPHPAKRIHMMTHPVFAWKYREWMPYLYQSLGLSVNATYAVAHWRRGDQLTATNRCRAGGDSVDKSVNCGTVQELISQLKTDMNRTVSGDSPELTYIATNEKDKKTLAYLSSHGYKLLSDVLAGTQNGKKLNPPISRLSSLDAFVIELMLICDSTYLYAWGVSGSHNFFYFCRMIDKTKKHVTVINDKTSLGHGHHINNHTVVVQNLTLPNV